LAVAGGSGEGVVRKVLTNPQIVRKVWEKIETVGLRQTVDLIRVRQESVVPLGYSAAGEVIEVGREVQHVKVGDRVACAGAGYANHAEVNFVPQNLVALIPDAVPYSDAVFATLGAIALQGVRRLAPTLGEQIVVIGLGLIGQLAVQMVRLSGCRVFGVDLLDSRIQLGRNLGMEDGVRPDARDPLQAVLEWTGGVGADGAIICATGGDAALLNRSFDLCRRKGRLVLIGDIPIRVSREKIYKKELDFLISCSYGPGRYDPRYEEQGIDYPLSYVRWTEGRNLSEVLRLLNSSSLRVSDLVQATFPVEEASAAYNFLQTSHKPIAVLLDYHLPERAVSPIAKTIQVLPKIPVHTGQITLGVIGAGSFFRGVHLPNLIRHGGFFIKSASARSGAGLREMATRYGIPFVTSDAKEILEDPEICAVLIATRHNLHAPFILEAARAGKHVFVEKPMALTVADCEEILSVVGATGILLTVGFNRRFPSFAREAKSLVGQVREPKTVLYRVNAGPLPADHWLRDPLEGGGRLMGEGVHFFDFVRWLVGTDPLAVKATALDRGPAQGIDPDNVSVSVSFCDGSLGVVLYTSQGHPSLPKERIEIFAGGSSIVIHDFSSLEVYGIPGRKGKKTKKSEKGHFEIVDNFYKAIKGTQELDATARDGYWATWCAEQAQKGVQGNE
jgi:predicted dehydrogenase/threonine dehydrogenase-like Zn-dependent dehydrogenase